MGTTGGRDSKTPIYWCTSIPAVGKALRDESKPLRQRYVGQDEHRSCRRRLALRSLLHLQMVKDESKPPPKRGLTLERRRVKGTRAPKGPYPLVLYLWRNKKVFCIKIRHDFADYRIESSSRGLDKITVRPGVLVKGRKLNRFIFLDQFRPVASTAGP